MSENDVPSVALGHYWQALRRGWWMVVLGAVVGVGLAVGLLAVVPSMATAQARVELSVISSDPFNVNRAASELIDLAGESQVASSSAVAARAAERVEGATAVSIRDAIEVTGVADTTILHINATAGSSNEAQDIANAVAMEFLEFRAEQAEERIERTVEQSNEQLDPLRIDLEEADERILSAEPGSAEEAQGQSDRAFVVLQIDAVLSHAAAVQSIDTASGTLITAADGSSISWTPGRGLTLASGLAAGLGIGVVAAFALGGRRVRVRTAADVVRYGGRLLLGHLSTRSATFPPAGQDLQELMIIRERMLSESDVLESAEIVAVVDDCDEIPSVFLSLAFAIARSGAPTECVLTETDFVQITDLLELDVQLHADQPPMGTRYYSSTMPLLTLVVLENVALIPARGQAAEVPWRDDALVLLNLGRNSAIADRLAGVRLANALLCILEQGESRTNTLTRIVQDAHSLDSLVLGCVLVSKHRAIGRQYRSRIDR